MSFTFYLGTHVVNWLEIVNIPWFVSVNSLINRKSKINGINWVMDSGGFTQILKHGSYNISEQSYLACIEKQNPKFAFCQDWMCEPVQLQKTGLSVKEHQERTLESYMSLRQYSDKIRPVLQGWTSEEYVTHIKMYKQANVNFDEIFGVGTICSRNNNTPEIYRILSEIKKEMPQIRLHGFGLKITSIQNHNIRELLESVDSLAWSYGGRMDKLCANSCPNLNCANCMEYALLWRKKILNILKKDKK